MKGYCVKCKDKAGRDMNDVKIDRTKKGGYMAKGTCSKCNTKMCRMMSKADAEKMLSEEKAQ